MDRISFNTPEYWGQRDRIYERDCGKCQSPHCVNMPEYSVGDDWQLDHIVPISKGGNNEDYNMRVLCLFCHITRDDSNLEPTSFNSHSKLGLSYLLTDRLEESIYNDYQWSDEIE